MYADQPMTEQLLNTVWCLAYKVRVMLKKMFSGMEKYISSLQTP